MADRDGLDSRQGLGDRWCSRPRGEAEAATLHPAIDETPGSVSGRGMAGIGLGSRGGGVGVAVCMGHGIGGKGDSRPEPSFSESVSLEGRNVLPWLGRDFMSYGQVDRQVCE